jgi:hypothetical protein
MTRDEIDARIASLKRAMALAEESEFWCLAEVAREELAKMQRRRRGGHDGREPSTGDEWALDIELERFKDELRRLLEHHSADEAAEIWAERRRQAQEDADRRG